MIFNRDRNIGSDSVEHNPSLFSKIKKTVKQEKKPDHKNKSTQNSGAAGFLILQELESVEEALTESRALTLFETKNLLSSESEGLTNEQEKMVLLLKILKSEPKKAITPKLNLLTGKVTFPALSKIGEREDNVTFLEKLTSPSCDFLEKYPHEKILTCPTHESSFSVSVRLYCPKCNSMNIEKLQLLEHKKCGYISEKKNYQLSSSGEIIGCPLCKKKIDDTKQEIRIPAMWYTCNDCNERFDDVLIKLHCRDFYHDFDTNLARQITIFGYRLKGVEQDITFDKTELVPKLITLLNLYDFEVEENHSIKGKSGHYHNIDLYGKDKENHTVFILFKKSNQNNDSVEINSKIIQVLDTSPDLVILVATTPLPEKLRTIAVSYKMFAVSSQDVSEIINQTGKILSEKMKKKEGRMANASTI